MRATKTVRPLTFLTPGDPGWDDARRAWNLAVDQHPAAVAIPRTAHDVVAGGEEGQRPNGLGDTHRLLLETV